MRPAPGWGRGPECPTSPLESVRPRFLSPWSRWRRAVGWCGPGLARRAGQLTFEGGEGIDDRRRLEGPVPSPDVDLAHDAGASRRFIASLVAWKLRPMSFAAPVTETTGAPGRVVLRPVAAASAAWRCVVCLRRGDGAA
jgi:hypothetical protein